MFRKEIIAITVVVVFVAIVCVTDSTASITDVNIVPSPPTSLDVISIVTFGVESRGDVLIDGSNFDREGTSLQLDIFLNVGVFPMITPWSHSEDIGTLPVGIYDLTVRTFEVPDVTDTYSMTFEVVPEPATVLLLGLGMIGVRAG